jgi:hypothetical protein
MYQSEFCWGRRKARVGGGGGERLFTLGTGSLWGTSREDFPVAVVRLGPPGTTRRMWMESAVAAGGGRRRWWSFSPTMVLPTAPYHIGWPA